MCLFFAHQKRKYRRLITSSFGNAIDSFGSIVKNIRIQRFLLDFSSSSCCCQVCCSFFTIPPSPCRYEAIWLFFRFLLFSSYVVVVVVVLFGPARLTCLPISLFINKSTKKEKEGIAHAVFLPLNNNNSFGFFIAVKNLGPEQQQQKNVFVVTHCRLARPGIPLVFFPGRIDNNTLEPG